MVEQTQVQRIKSILKQIQELKEEDEKAAQATGKNFNVFSVLGVERKEVRHSAFLKDLLDPKGTHSQGAVFLEHFLKLPPLLKKLPRSFYENLEEFQVTKEQYAPYSNNEYGLIDIFLKKRDACIIIENKIDRSLDPGQLNKYYTYAKGMGFRQICLVYLTPEGKKPSKESLAGQEPLDADRVICISYESHIVEWLEEWLREVVGIARLHEVLLQYQELTKELIGQPKELTMKIRDVLTRDYDLFIELNNSITEIKKCRRHEFFRKVKEKITNDGIEILDNKQVRITAKVSIFKDPCVTMILQVSGKENPWYGFSVHRKGRDVSECYKGHFKKHLNLTPDWKTDWGLGWKDLKDRDPPVSFSDSLTEQMRYIVDDNEFNNMVEKIAQEIKDAVDKFREAKENAGL